MLELKMSNPSLLSCGSRVGNRKTMNHSGDSSIHHPDPEEEDQKQDPVSPKEQFLTAGGKGFVVEQLLTSKRRN